MRGRFELELELEQEAENAQNAKHQNPRREAPEQEAAWKSSNALCLNQFNFAIAMLRYI